MAGRAAAAGRQGGLLVQRQRLRRHLWSNAQVTHSARWAQQFAARPADRQTVMGRPARIFLAVELVLGVTYFRLPDSLLRAVVYCTLGLGMVVAVVVGARLYRPSRPLAWYLLAAGQLSFTVGDAINYTYQWVLEVEPPYPSVADAFYLACYALLAAGLLLLVRERAPGRDVASLIDATIITTGVGLLSWVFLIGPNVRVPDLLLSQRLVSIAYPLCDVLLVAVAVRMGRAGPAERPADPDPAGPAGRRLPEGPGGAGHPDAAGRAARRRRDRRRLDRAVPAHPGPHGRPGQRGGLPDRAQAGHADGAAGDRAGAGPAGRRPPRRAGAGADRAPLRPHPGPQPHPARAARPGRGPAGRARGRAGRRHHRPATAHGRAAAGRARRAGSRGGAAQPGVGLRGDQRGGLRHLDRPAEPARPRSRDRPVPGHPGVAEQRRQARRRVPGHRLAGRRERLGAPADQRRRGRLRPDRGQQPPQRGPLRPGRHARTGRDGRRPPQHRLSS